MRDDFAHLTVTAGFVLPATEVLARGVAVRHAATFLGLTTLDLVYLVERLPSENEMMVAERQGSREGARGERRDDLRASG